MIVRRVALCMIAMLLLAGCGYHLVGHGDGGGVIPAGVHSLNIVARGEGEQLLSDLQGRLNSDQLTVSINSRDSDKGSGYARLIVQISLVRFTPSAYDASGIASQYRMVYAGSISLEQNGQVIWQSGKLAEQGDVYVSGDPASIEASRRELLRGLRKQWLQTAVSRLNSGF